MIKMLAVGAVIGFVVSGIMLLVISPDAGTAEAAQQCMERTNEFNTSPQPPCSESQLWEFLIWNLSAWGLFLFPLILLPWTYLNWEGAWVKRLGVLIGLYYVGFCGLVVMLITRNP